MKALQAWLGVLETAFRARGLRRRRLELPDGRFLSYLEAGHRRKGPVFVLVHGLGSSGIVWVRTLLRLGRRHRCVALDLPGYGRSPMPDGRVHQTIDELAEAVVAAISTGAFGPRVHLVGQSLGGWVSVKVARRLPQNLDQLVLVNAAGYLYPGIEGLRQVMDLQSREAVHEFWKRLWFRVPHYYRPFWRAAAANLRTANVLRFLETLTPGDFVNDDLPQLEVPVSLVWGRADRFMPGELVDHFVGGLGSTRVYWIARCGHIPAVEQPNVLVRILVGLADDTNQARLVTPAAHHAASRQGGSRHPKRLAHKAG